MKSENRRSTILTIREYENSVAMPADERVTYLDSHGNVHLKNDSADHSFYAQKCAEYLRFGSEVDATIHGEYNRTNALKICDTPELYIRAGFDALPMLYTQRHLHDALRPKNDYNPHHHGLTVEQVKRLPELLADPVMLCDSPSHEDRMLSLLCAVDGDNLPLIVAIEPHGHGYYELRGIETNFIVTVFGRKKFSRYFDNLITPDKVIYYNAEKGRELNALASLQLLRSHIVEPDLLNTIIRRPNCLVNSDVTAQDTCGLDSQVAESRAAADKLASDHGNERPSRDEKR